jgi:putative transposase
VPGYTYHVTHRCHDRAFLFRFGKYRKAYREMLRQRLATYHVSLFSYCITSNHVHLLVRPSPSGALESLSCLLRSLEGDFAQFYNRRKKRENAFWGDRYHATMIDSGEHLWKCLCYIDLNMVRAGAVRHPKDWEWTAYQELMGLRRRYCLVDMTGLLDQLGAGSEDAFRRNYAHQIDVAIQRGELKREAKWTESLAVGSESFVERVGRQVDNRMQVTRLEDETDRSLWILREPQDVLA